VYGPAMSCQTIPGVVGPRLTRRPIVGLAGALGATGVVGPTGSLGAVGPFSVQGSPGPTGLQGQTGSFGATGVTGPNVNGGVFGPFRSSPDHSLSIRMSGSPSRLLSMARGWLRGMGHSWQVLGTSMVCHHCMAFVLVDPVGEGLPGTRFRDRAGGGRRLLQRRYPGSRDVRLARSSFPSCAVMRQRLVEAVSDR